LKVTGHLRPEELLDLAEAPRPDAASGHLASCALCRRELSDLREALAAAAAIDVPEPSPLFWGHLSARVREAVDAEASAEPQALPLRWPVWRLGLPLGLAGALALALAVGLRTDQSEPGAAAGLQEPSVSIAEGASAPAAGTATDDLSIDLIADLAGEWDWEFATEAGLAARAGAVESLLDELSDEERLELRRLLEEELSSGGGV
jgi:hypothetical protein